MGDPHATHAVMPNKGLEAAAYVHAILDNYHALPDLLVFMHGHDSGW